MPTHQSSTNRAASELEIFTATIHAKDRSWTRPSVGYLVDDAGAAAELLVGQEVGDGIALSQAQTLGGLEGRDLGGRKDNSITHVQRKRNFFGREKQLQ